MNPTGRQRSTQHGEHRDEDPEPPQSDVAARVAARARWAAKVSTEGVKDAMHATDRIGEGIRNRAVNAAKQIFRRLRRPLRAASRRRSHMQERWGHYRTEWGIEREIEAVVGRGRLLVAGPWLSEVGFETLYWVPFLQWLTTAYRIEPERLVAVSRGGVGSWYHGIAGRYVEIWDEIDPADFARRNAARGVTKQYESSALDRDVLDAVTKRIGSSDFDVLHPGLMYRLFTLYWSGQRATGFLDAHLRFTMATPPAIIDPALLPSEYVAVKLYAARSLPETPETVALLRAMVRGLAEQTPVVLLDTGLVLEDDHADYQLGGGRVISAKAWMTPQNNLGVQTQIIAGAKEFVGTCGSIAWLAPRLGIDTSALYVDPKWLHAHLTLAMRAYHKLGAGRFAAADLRALHVLPRTEQVPLPVKLLFIARHYTYFRNFESVVGALAERGHQVHLATDREDTQGGEEIVARLARRWPGVTYGVTPIRDWGRYRRVSRALRLGLDYLRYSDPRFESMPKIRQRARDRTPAFVLALARLPFRRLIAAALERLEAAVPVQTGIDAFIREQAPDLLLVTPLIELGSPQLDYVRAAARLGVPSALAVWSWDHLSSKALIRVLPDAVIVWNSVQKDEAARFHGIAADRVVVTGAQCFDQWFDRGPSRSRDEFCRRVGLPDAGLFLLYTCSALFRGSPSEAGLVRRWIDAIRASAEPRLRAINILVRPHPQRPEDWSSVIDLDRVVVWGSNPIDAESRADYFDSLFHSGGVVGLNTSALVEAAIVDRPVYTVLLPEYRENQEGTFHFHHLLTVGDGFLNAARSLDEHVVELTALVDGQAPARNRAFVERFIRPGGLDVPATPVFVQAVETLASHPVTAARPAPAWVILLRPVIYALVLAGRLPLLERLYWNPGKLGQRVPADDHAPAEA